MVMLVQQMYVERCFTLCKVIGVLAQAETNTPHADAECRAQPGRSVYCRSLC